MTQNSSLAKLTNQELEFRLKDLAIKERKLLHVILEHIKELEIRKLYLARAYPSVFEYLVKELGYSNSAAMRRLEAARLLRDVPIVAQKIQEGTLNLSQIGELSRALKEKEKISGGKVSYAVKAELVHAISGKTTKETQKELAVTLDIPIREIERQKVQQDQSLRIEITLNKNQLEKLNQCKNLAAHLLMQKFNCDHSWATLFEVLADQYLNKRKAAPLKKHPLTLSNDEKAISAQFTSATQENNMREPKVLSSKLISIADAAIEGRIYKKMTPLLRRKILLRDECCQFIDPQTQKRCQSKFGLEVDHKTSQWAGGQHTSSNLQALCRKHNIHKYHLESGIRVL